VNYVAGGLTNLVATIGNAGVAAIASPFAAIEEAIGTTNYQSTLFALDMLSFGMAGVLAEIPHLSQLRVLQSAARDMDAAVALEARIAKLAPGMGSGAAAEEVAIHYRSIEAEAESLMLGETRFTNNNGIDAAFINSASMRQMTDEYKFVSDYANRSLEDLASGYLSNGRYGVQGTVEYSERQAWRLIRSPVATQGMRETGTVLATSTIEASVVFIDEFANLHRLDSSWIELLRMR
jgi:hypothetical protein